MRISVIIPARNRAWSLPACLDSIIGQTLAPDEIIVVDDASTDETFQVVKAYSDFGVVGIHLEKSGGAQAARNSGIRRARGDWIAFQDSDDLWLPTKLERQANELEKVDFDPYKVVHTDGQRFDVVSGFRSLIQLSGFQGKCVRKLVLTSGPMFQGLLVSKKAIVDVGMLDETCPSHHEWDTSIRLAGICEFIHIAEPLFEWVRHRRESISNDTRREILGHQYVLNKNRAAIISFYDERAWRRAKLGNIARALRAALWQDAMEMIEGEPRHRSLVLAEIFASAQFAPRGIGRLLHLASF